MHVCPLSEALIIFHLHVFDDISHLFDTHDDVVQFSGDGQLTETFQLLN